LKKIVERTGLNTSMLGNKELDQNKKYTWKEGEILSLLGTDYDFVLQKHIPKPVLPKIETINKSTTTKTMTAATTTTTTTTSAKKEIKKEKNEDAEDDNEEESTSKKSTKKGIWRILNKMN